MQHCLSLSSDSFPPCPDPEPPANSVALPPAVGVLLLLSTGVHTRFKFEAASALCVTVDAGRVLEDAAVDPVPERVSTSPPAAVTATRDSGGLLVSAASQAAAARCQLAKCVAARSDSEAIRICPRLSGVSGG